MFRDDREVLCQQVEQLRAEVDHLRAANSLLREQLLAAPPTALSPRSTSNGYVADLAARSPGERAALAHHGARPFPVWVVALLHLSTFGLFSVVYFSLLHDRLPRADRDDPSGAKAVALSFVPYFNCYWVFFNTLRLTDRINLQFRLRGLPPAVSRDLMLACAIVSVIPYVNILLGVPLLWTLGVCRLQRSINDLAALPPIARPAFAPSAVAAAPRRGTF